MHAATSAKWMPLWCMVFLTFINFVLEHEETVPPIEPQVLTFRGPALMVRVLSIAAEFSYTSSDDRFAQNSCRS